MLRQFFLTILLICSFLYAKEDVTIVQTTGVGLSRVEAVQSALKEAIKQTKGISFDTVDHVFSSKYQSSYANSNGYSSDYIAKSTQSLIKDATKGIVNSYKILEERQEKNGDWFVKIEAKLLNYKSPEADSDKKLKVAVMPFYINNSVHSKISDVLTNQITSNIIKSAKFAVLDRTYVDNLSQELGIIDSDQAPLEQKVKLGQKLGADYLVVGVIHEADGKTEVSRNSSTGESSSSSSVSFVVDYRVIVVGTAQITVSDTVMQEVDFSSIKGSSEIVVRKLLQPVALEISNAFIASKYPDAVAKPVAIKAEKPADNKDWKKSDLKQDGGGVKLPFD